ncbi:MAG: DNA-deoxyinosine glycosylase [Tenacibaculum sp.]
MSQNYIESFDPLLTNSPKILILGTLPGVESLKVQQYYGHARNVFWKIIFQFFKQPPTTNYSYKIDLLKQNKIALWDVCRVAKRKTSLDSDIKGEKPNAVEKLVEAYPSIVAIGFNGKKARELYDTFFNRKASIDYHTLLSTSPANAKYSFEEKFNNWKEILKKI